MSSEPTTKFNKKVKYRNNKFETYTQTFPVNTNTNNTTTTNNNNVRDIKEVNNSGSTNSNKHKNKNMNNIVNNNTNSSDNNVVNNDEITDTKMKNNNIVNNKVIIHQPQQFNSNDTNLKSQTIPLANANCNMKTLNTPNKQIDYIQNTKSTKNTTKPYLVNKTKSNVTQNNDYQNLQLKKSYNNNANNIGTKNTKYTNQRNKQSSTISTKEQDYIAYSSNRIQQFDKAFDYLTSSLLRSTLNTKDKDYLDLETVWILWSSYIHKSSLAVGEVIDTNEYCTYSFVGGIKLEPDIINNIKDNATHQTSYMKFSKYVYSV